MIIITVNSVCMHQLFMGSCQIALTSWFTECTLLIHCVADSTHHKEYARSLESQLLSSTESGQLDIGKSVSVKDLDLLHDGQIGQFYKLHQEIVKHHRPNSNADPTNS